MGSERDGGAAGEGGRSHTGDDESRGETPLSRARRVYDTFMTS